MNVRNADGMLRGLKERGHLAHVWRRVVGTSSPASRKAMPGKPRLSVDLIQGPLVSVEVLGLVLWKEGAFRSQVPTGAFLGSD